MIDEKDRLLLSYLQKGIPFTNRPFAVLGAKIGTDEADIILRIGKLMRGELTSGIKTVWDHRAFHYQGAWAAMKFPGEELLKKAEIVMRHPGVIYSIQKDDALNFWFYIMAPSGYDLEAHVRVLAKQTASQINLFLPMRRLLKGSGFLSSLLDRSYATVSEGLDNEKRKNQERTPLSVDEIRLIRILQEDFPLTDEPFRRISESLKMPEAVVLNLLAGLAHKGYLKKIGTESELKPAGSVQQQLVVWQIPEEKLDHCENVFAELPEVVYADSRPGYSQFPYTVYTLIKNRDAGILEPRLRKIEEKIGRWPSRVLSTVRELKKIPVQYFPKELDTWWVRNRLLADPALQGTAYCNLKGTDVIAE